MTAADSPQCCSSLQQELILLRNEQASLRATVSNLLNQLSMAIQANAELRIENQTLRDEIARLKGTPPRPKIPPGGLENSGKEPKGGNGNRGNSGRGKHPRSKKTGLTFHNINRFNQDAYDYLATHKDTEWLIQAFKIRQDPVFHTQDPGKTFLEEFGHLNANTIRLITEAGLFASLAVMKGAKLGTLLVA